MDSLAKAGLLAAECLSKVKIVPVLVLSSVDDGLKICSILQDSGLNAAEITFRTKNAEMIIKEVSKQFPGLYIGAGTVLNVYDLHRAMDAGAKFAVAPGLNPAVVREAANCGFAFAPGVCTPSEIEQSMELGCRFLKFFPAEAAGGVPMLRAMSAPYNHLGIRFMPTGGINPANVLPYLSLPQVSAVGGTWLGNRQDIESKNWDAIERNVREAAALIRG